jgi:hypothetical protein
MKIFRLPLPCLLAALLLTGCVSSSGRAPQAASGSKVEIMVLSDRGDTSAMSDYVAKAVGDLAPFMEKDLVEQLNRAGYQAKQIRARSEFLPGNGRYLLTTRIVNYNPGSSAARMVVGFGAGSASLDNHYELFGNGAQPVLAWDDGVGTSQHWTRLCRTLNTNAVKRLNGQLGGS